MSIQRSTREALYTLVPNGHVVTKQWLRDQGLGVHAIDNFVKSKQLIPVARGVYKRPGYDLEWTGIVASLELMEYPLLVGGLTALDINGYGHYVSLGDKSTIHLYGRVSEPSWLNKLGCSATFKTHSTAKLFSADLRLSEFTQASATFGSGQSKPSFSTCSPEAAYLQVLMDVPKALSFEYADKLMEGLSNLSPRRLGDLLHHCKNVKVKRLFFWYSERHQHAWLSRLNSKDYNLGTGKRSLVPGGKLDTHYNITVPANMYETR